MRPPTIRPGGDSRRIIDRLVTDLPEPDSPTTATRLAAPHGEADAVDGFRDAPAELEMRAKLLDGEDEIGGKLAHRAPIQPQCGQAPAAFRRAASRLVAARGNRLRAKDGEARHDEPLEARLGAHRIARRRSALSASKK